MWAGKRGWIEKATHLRVFSGLKEVLLVGAISHHEAMPIRDRNVVGRLSHFKVLSTEVAINDEGLHIFPPEAPTVSSGADMGWSTH